MEELDLARLLNQSKPKCDEEFQPLNNNKFIEITRYENTFYPGLSHGDLSDDNFSSFLDNDMSNEEIRNPRAIIARTKILFAGITPNDKNHCADLRMSAVNITMLTKKWRIPFFFFRSIREQVAIVQLLRPNPENTNLQGFLATFPCGVLSNSGAMCIVHDQEHDITYCLCIGWFKFMQEEFQEYIFGYLNRFYNPGSILLMKFDFVITNLKSQMTSSAIDVIHIATALSTGRYDSMPTAKPFSKDLRNITKLLTMLADYFAILKHDTIIILRMLGDICKITGALIEMPDAMQAVDLDTTKLFDEEDLLNHLANSAQAIFGMLQAYSEKTQAHIQTVYSLAAQRDSNASIRLTKLARRDTKLNTLIATLARRDSTDMRVITWITLVFLPGTFTATLFSASFFNFQPDNNGPHVSRWIALYWGVTVFLTALVFVARYLLFQSKTKLKTDVIDKLIQETSDFVDVNDEDEEDIYLEDMSYRT